MARNGTWFEWQRYNSDDKTKNLHAAFRAGGERFSSVADFWLKHYLNYVIWGTFIYCSILFCIEYIFRLDQDWELSSKKKENYDIFRPLTLRTYFNGWAFRTVPYGEGHRRFLALELEPFATDTAAFAQIHVEAKN